MNQLEQFREQCINVAQQYANNAHNNSSQNAAMEIRDLIRALPLPEVSHDPVAWVMTMRDNIKNSLSFFTCKDIGEQWLIEEKDLGFNDLKLQPLYVLPPDVEALRKENERLSTVEYCFNEWLEKTKWVQETAQPHELGMHRADVLKNRIDALREVLKEALELMEYNADYFPESGVEDRSTIEKIKAVLGITTPQPKTATGHVMFKTNGMMIASDPDGHVRVEMSASDDEGAA